MITPAAIPPEVRDVCKRLRDAGFSAYVVGGAVRDLLRGERAKDFDLTTSALPEAVQKLFPSRTVPTGLQHGTVTVLCDRSSENGRRQPPLPVEVTTFRGESTYSDGRRPDRVAFIDDLTEDLRRRDFTINAIAYDPIGDDGAGRLADPFGGESDLRAGLIRAVGDPAARFGEDGLRVLRAVRFAAQLGFAVDPPTRAAFAGALDTLRKVSRERVRDELVKLLGAARPSVGLTLLAELPPGLAGQTVLSVAFPEVDEALSGSPQVRAQFYARVDRTERGPRRLAAFLWPLRRAGEAGTRAELADLADLIDARLKLPSRERDHLAALLTAPRVAYDLRQPLSDAGLRRLLADFPPVLLDDLLALEQADAQLGVAPEPDRAAALADLVARVAAERARKPPLSVGELALTGKDLVKALARPPGPWVGERLRALLDAVLTDPAANTREQLLELARAADAPEKI